MSNPFEPPIVIVEDVDTERAEITRQAFEDAWVHLGHALTILHEIDDESYLFTTPFIEGVQDQAYALARGIEVARRLTEAEVISTTFPEGKRAPRQLTPKQASWLLDLAVQQQARQRHQQRAEIPDRRDYGGYPQRSCLTTTKGGHRCRSKALAFLESPVCASHASVTERATNAERKAVYEAAVAEHFANETEVDDDGDA